jgi:PDZ-binding kinase
VCQHLDDNLALKDEDAEYVGTEPWCAKEVLDDGVISNKTDIFAFGLTLWEMWSLQVPHMQEVRSEEDVDSDAEEILEGIPMNCSSLGTRPPIPEDIMASSAQAPLVDIFLVCTVEDQTKRPSARTLLKAFENLKSFFVETPPPSPTKS